MDRTEGQDTIAAIATAQGAGGVAIVRVSGEGALGIARGMFSHRGEWVPNLMTAGTIDCGDFRDFGLCVYFKAPRSFTGEDVVEFHCHGGAQIARGVLRRALALGARPAEAGEFTKRAYLCGKLSLSAVEGMGEMIGARSAAQVRAGYLLYAEKLTDLARTQKKAIGECLAMVDADVDYPEEELTTDVRREVLERLPAVEEALCGLLSQYRAGRRIREGVKVAVCGRPNAGKSSLFNALLGYDRAIVSSVAGTTRDTVEEELEIGGVRFLLCDTAGIRESGDELEREGMRRTERAVRAADVIVWLSDCGEEPALPETEAPVIRVGTKCDLGARQGCDIALSAKTGEGLEAFKALLYERGYGQEGDVLLLEERHYHAVREALGAVRAAKKGAEEGLPSELFAEDLMRAYSALGLLGGESASEEIVSEIFSKFCVGK